MNEKKFKKGDSVTFKYYNEFRKGYYYGGFCQGGTIGEILSYICYIEEKSCWKIQVSFDKCGRSSRTYSMLESEFKEFENFNKLYNIY